MLGVVTGLVTGTGGLSGSTAGGIGVEVVGSGEGTVIIGGVEAVVPVPVAGVVTGLVTGVAG